jgi:hypothetical protein
MKGCSPIGMFILKVLDILGKVRSLRLVHLATYTQGKGFSDEKGYIDSFAIGRTNHSLSLVPRGLQAD